MNIASYIDHTILKPTTLVSDIEKLCTEAMEYKFAAVCVPPMFVSRAKELVDGSGMKVATVIGFPFGYSAIEAKVAETVLAIVDGADEIDMVINVGRLKDKDYEYVKDDISAVVLAAKGHEVKVILETCLLDEDEKIMACQLSQAAGAAFVKTSTGFSTSGAHIEDIKLMRATVGEKMGVKASGGIRTLKDAVKMIDAGATRLGLSATVNILNELDE